MAWYNSNWKYRVKITVDKDKVGSTLTDFPVYVDLSTLPSGFHSNVKSDGGDIRVTRSDGTTECPREVVFYDSTNDKGELHFKANSLSSTTDTVFYIYYGNSSASDYATNATYGAEHVWDSNYKIVAHMGNDPSGGSGAILDSSSCGHNGTAEGSMTSGDVVTGKIGKGLDHDGVNDEINWGSSSDFSIETGNFTVSCWVRKDEGSSSWSNVAAISKWNTGSSGGTNEWVLGLTLSGSDNKAGFSVEDGSTEKKAYMTSGITLGQFYYLVGVRDGANIKFYLNGEISATTDIGSSVNIDNVSNRNFKTAGIEASNNYNLQGIVDEVRISKGIARSSDWISTEYSNQNSPTTFYTVGTQEAVEGWYNSNWKYRVKITVDHSKVGSDLTDFPVYVDLSTLPSGFHTNVKSDGGDIRVTRSDGTTECPREVVFYDSTNDKGELHFKANSLSSTTDTVFYIYYGNSSASDYATDATYGSENVWDSNFKIVHHLKDSTTSSVLDSTSNSLDGTKMSAGNPAETTGKIGRGQDFSDDHIALGDLAIGTTYTAEVWIKPDNLTGSGDTATYGFTVMASNSTYGSGYPLWITVLGTEVRLWAYESTAGTGGWRQTSSAGLSTGSWFHIQVIATKSGISKVYVNGVERLSFTNDGEVNWCNVFTLGDLRPTRNIRFDGQMDEVRVSNIIRSADYMGAEYTNQSSPTTFYTVGTQEVEGWYNSSWKYRVKITVDHSKVGSDLTDFPVYVDLSTLPSGFHTNVKSDGGDIRVTRSDGTTECPREVVFYDSTNDKGELHFKANSLSSTTDTNFYIYYGNSSATEPASDATYGSENVWSAYEGVWHMGDASTTTIADSTSNGYTGTKLSAGNPSETTGKIGKAQSFSTDRINMGDVLDMGTNDITMSQWIKLSNITTPVHSMAKAKADATLYRYSIRYSSSGTAGFFMAGSSGQTIYESTTVVDDDTWRLITVVLDRSGSGTVYVNGSSIGSQSISTYDGQNFQSICNFWLGAYPSSDNTNIYSSYPGLIDESRITLTSLSATWISTEYNNQSSPSTFYTVGTQEAGSIVGKKYPLPPFRRSV